MSADLILTNGNFYTPGSSHPHRAALAFEHGRVAGWDDQAEAERGPHTRVIDLGGKTIIPGLVDSHIHFTGFALGLRQVNLEGARSLSEAVARVAARIQDTARGEWVSGHSWNHNDWDVPVFPTKAALDAVAPDNPVVLTRKDGHSMWLNSAALFAAGITRETPDPAGGKIERDDAGDPNGILREQAMNLMGAGIGVGEEEIAREDLVRAIAHAHRAGLTAIHNIEGPSALRAFQDLRARDELNLRVTQFFPIHQIEHAIALGLEQGFGDEWLGLAGVKIFSDGALGSQTAWMLEPFEQSLSRGMPLTPRGEIERVARLAAQHNLQVAIHAIGDAANRTVLDIIEKLRGEGFRQALFRIEHAQHLTQADVPRFARLNVIASVQPIHQPSDMFVADRTLGKRARWTYPFRSLLDSGASLYFGSDCPVETLDPLRGIHAAVTRQNENGEPADGWYPEERISVPEAVSAYTRTAHPSDWVVLSRNIFEIPPREILETRVEYTIVGGNIVYAANQDA